MMIVFKAQMIKCLSLRLKLLDSPNAKGIVHIIYNFLFLNGYIVKFEIIKGYVLHKKFKGNWKNWMLS